MSIVRPLLIAMLVLTEVGLWQWRMVIAARGSRSSAMLLGTLGALLQITAISQVVTNVTTRSASVRTRWAWAPVSCSGSLQATGSPRAPSASPS